MRKILLVAFVFAVVLAIFLFSNRDQKTEKPTHQKEEPIIVAPHETITPITKKTIQLSGIVVPDKLQKVVFQFNGTLENGEQDFAAGSKFHKGQLLFQVNNLDAYLKMQSAKMALKEKLNASLHQLQSKKKAWEDYIASLEPVSLIGELPEFSTAEEQSLLNSLQIKQEHLNIKKMEANMSNYFWIAPFDGIVLQRLVKHGQKIKSGEKVAEIGRVGTLLVKTEIADEISNLSPQQKVTILDNQKKIICEGKFAKSISTKNGLSTAYFTIEKSNKIILGTNVIVEIQR